MTQHGEWLKTTLAGFDLDTLELDLQEEPGWSFVENSVVDELRWVNLCEKIVRHENGAAVRISYASNTGDGESASTWGTTWCEVEPVEKTVTVWQEVKSDG